MVSKRIIPCLDVKDGRVVKGTNFVNLRDAGSAVELSERYYKEGADELVFLDITASEEKRKTLIDLVKDVASVIRIPFTVGGGISEISDIEDLLRAGADKVSLNTSIVKNPELISEAAKRFGSQAVVAAIDVNLIDNEYRVFVKGGKELTELIGIDWCKKVIDHGAGEILLTSMNKDGTKSGYDIEFLKQLDEISTVPVIASGGAGTKEHFLEAFKKANADACLAASLFHYQELSIEELKEYLRENRVESKIMIKPEDMDYEKLGGIFPAIILDVETEQVLMLGFMNEEAYRKTLGTNEVTFYSRTNKRLWTKGETSGNKLLVERILSDCDSDTLLIYAKPLGNTCHTGSYSCFNYEKKDTLQFLNNLFSLIKQRKEDLPEGSYTTKLFKSGDNRIAQKVGEEAIETVIAFKNKDKEEIVNEVSDLIYHLFVMLVQSGIEFTEISDNLEKRHRK